MSLTVAKKLLLATTCEALEEMRTHNAESRHRNDRDIDLDVGHLSNTDLVDVMAACHSVEDIKTARAVEAILKGRSGKFEHPVPNFKAFEAMLKSFLEHALVDGWVFVRGNDGKMYPELITATLFDSGDQSRGQGRPRVYLHTVAYSLHDERRNGRRLGMKETSYGFEPGDVTKKRIADILAERGIYKETPDLKADYLASMERHGNVAFNGFAKQFKFTGQAFFSESDDYRNRGIQHSNRKVIHDLETSDYAAIKQHADSSLFQDGVGNMPEHPLVRVFDLKTEEFFWVHSDFMTPYVYDKGLRDKLILPQSHRDLLDVLTTDIEAFSSDIIEGKAAGNIVLNKGAPGLGKTLTAEIYSEIVGSPLYAIHSGTLGTTASEIDATLQIIFSRARRWNCVLLLDEADVFVMKRGTDLEHNAIVAEFLRVLEYFEKLMFMTTNRPDDIDEAVISRCAAIIAYEVPGRSDAAAIWRVMAKNFEAELNDGLIEQLLDLFPTIAPRDIKMLLRLALRVGRHHAEELSIELFRRCAMFRAISMTSEGVKAA